MGFEWTVHVYRVLRGRPQFSFNDRPIDLREIASDPQSALKHAGYSTFVIDVPVSDCRNKLGFAYRPDGVHPLVRTARAYAAGKASCYDGSPLQVFRRHFQPTNAAEKYGIYEGASRELLASLPNGLVHPWEDRSFAKQRQKAHHSANRDRVQYGLEQLDDPHATPDAEKGAFEFDRLAQLVDSVREKGYRRTNLPSGDIIGKLLIRPGEGARYIVFGGRHRAAVLAALGYDRIPLRMRFSKFPTIDDVDEWPHVRSGLFTRDQAIDIYNRLWDGQPPTGAVPPEWQG